MQVVISFQSGWPAYLTHCYQEDRQEPRKRTEDCMKFMLLVYTDENAWTESERAQCYQDSMGLAFELRASGRFLATSPLQAVAKAKSVRMRSGKRTILDG